MIRRMMRLLPGAALLLLAATLLAVQNGLLADIPPGRVEIVCGQGLAALAQAFTAVREEPPLMNLEAAWEGERLVVTGVDVFTAQRLETALVRAGLAAEELRVLDYAWAGEVLAQSGRLWRMAGALALVWLFARWALALVQREYRRSAATLEGCYLSDYLWQHSVRLLAEAVALTAGALASLILLRWLWRYELTLPTGLLPEGSIFDGAHYRQWWAEAFPAGDMSACGRILADTLQRTHLLSAGEAAALLLAAGLTPIQI